MFTPNQQSFIFKASSWILKSHEGKKLKDLIREFSDNTAIDVTCFDASEFCSLVDELAYPERVLGRSEKEWTDYYTFKINKLMEIIKKYDK